MHVNRLGGLKSPYQNSGYNFGKNYPKGKLDEGHDYVQGGCLHSYLTLETAELHLAHYDELILECAIPKGTKYLIGKDSECVSMVLDVQSVVKYSKAIGSSRIEKFEKRYNIVWS